MHLVDELHTIASVLRSAGVRHGGEHLCVDLLIADAVFAGLLDDAIEVRVPQGPLTVISRAGLIKMKRLAGRPQDVADLARLEGGDD